MRPAQKEWASAAFSGRKPKVTPLSERHIISTVWERGALRKLWEGIIDMIICQKVMPVAGSGRSNIRFVVSSHVLHVPSLDDNAAWRATKDEYIPLHEKEMIV